MELNGTLMSGAGEALTRFPAHTGKSPASGGKDTRFSRLRRVLTALPTVSRHEGGAAAFVLPQPHPEQIQFAAVPPPRERRRCRASVRSSS